MINASIITIGDELLIGQVVDTNSAFIAQELNKAGFAVKRRVAVGDDRAAIISALDEEKIHSDIIIITGGLGPTADDITKPLLCDYFGGKLIVNEEAVENVKYLFREVFKRPESYITERNLKQGEVPDCCIVMQNKRGTAPGMIFTQNHDGREKTFFSLPGVPHEMAGMVTDSVLPFIIERYSASIIEHRTLLTAGAGESFLADMLIDFENNLSASIKLAYLPSFGMVRLRLTSNTEKHDEENVLDKNFDALKNIVSEYLVTDRDEPMEAYVGRLLKEKGKKIATAESCTGGYIAHLLTAKAGSSSYYEGSVVSYSYAAKETLLGVSADLLEKHGAVSEEVVKQMASGLLERTATDYVIAVSGIMGPEGGMPDKPVGTVWICTGNRTRLEAQKFTFRFDREKNIRFTALNALNMVRKFILNDVNLKDRLPSSDPLQSDFKL